MGQQVKGYTAAVDYDEHEIVLPVGSGTALRGEGAAGFGRELVARVVGRPAWDRAVTRGEYSPRRQVRLPQTLSGNVGQLAAIQKDVLPP